MFHRLILSLLGWAAAALLVGGTLAAGNAAAQANQPAAAPGSAEFIRPVTSRDHIRGDPNAPVKIVEFGDTECPLCKRFHPTLQRIVAEYPGKVAWVFRHFPIDAIHPKARKEAEATECAAELGGNDKFWTYLDRLYEITPSNDKLDPAELPRIAAHVGLNRAQFESCLQSGKHAQRVAEDVDDALVAGATGTPYTVVIAPNGRLFAILGAQPYATVKLVVDIALQQRK
ncbi:DsbA family protein [Thiobacillus denitrificans]|uniref:DsbA family protein n=1 Tax=Thiobacillus denitrificans TaxID=36861 RepID=UPI00075EB98A|nr:thioredoxin domain-containing protein [Thiobacillus denitrificans]